MGLRRGVSWYLVFTDCSQQKDRGGSSAPWTRAAWFHRGVTGGFVTSHTVSLILNTGRPLAELIYIIYNMDFEN